MRIFRTKKQIEREQRKNRRKAFRQAQNSIDNVKEHINRLSKECDENWQKAREAVKSGQTAARNRYLTSYRAGQVMATKLEQKRWVFEQYVTKMEVADSDKEFSGALASLNKVIKIDPDAVADVFDEAQDILGEQVDADRFWKELYSKEMEGARGSLEDYIPAMDDLRKQLEDEATAEVGGRNAGKEAMDASEKKDPASGEISGRIDKVRKDVSDLLDNENKS